MSNATDLKKLFSALSFSAEKHRDQRRLNIHASPYINHPIEVAQILSEEGEVKDLDALCGRVLNGTIESTEATPGELIRRFGTEVCGIVLEVPDDKTLPKGTRKALQVVNAPHSSHRADGIRGTNAGLEAAFDRAYAKCPVSPPAP